jgi:hypothetical protein
MISEVTTWGDVLEQLKNAPPEVLAKPAQVICHQPNCDEVFECRPAVSLGTVDELGFDYVRSSVDNRRNGDELVLYVDYNPFAEDGASGYTMTDDEDIPFYPPGHDASSDWTGPAQKLHDEAHPDGV